MVVAREHVQLMLFRGCRFLILLFSYSFSSSFELSKSVREKDDTNEYSSWFIAIFRDCAVGAPCSVVYVLCLWIEMPSLRTEARIKYWFSEQWWCRHCALHPIDKFKTLQTFSRRKKHFQNEINSIYSQMWMETFVATSSSIAQNTISPYSAFTVIPCTFSTYLPVAFIYLHVVPPNASSTSIPFAIDDT